MTDPDLLAAIKSLTEQIEGLRADLNRSPGPARGLTTNIRALSEHKHQVGPRMGFGAVNVHEEQQ